MKIGVIGHMGYVGESTVFGVWGTKSWDSFVAYGENIRQFHELKDDEVRFVFFFDN